jgi:hypothetical protein
MPQAQDQSEHQELHRVVAAVDRPEQGAAVGELVVDAETGSDEAGAGDEAVDNGGVERRARAQPQRERAGRDQREEEAEAEDLGRVAGLLRGIGFAAPEAAEEREYQTPPSRKELAAPTRTAQRLMLFIPRIIRSPPDP